MGFKQMAEVEDRRLVGDRVTPVSGATTPEVRLIDGPEGARLARG
jgi:hypothetical protein